MWVRRVGQVASDGRRRRAAYRCNQGVWIGRARQISACGASWGAPAAAARDQRRQTSGRERQGNPDALSVDVVNRSRRAAGSVAVSDADRLIVDQVTKLAAVVRGDGIGAAG